MLLSMDSIEDIERPRRDSRLIRSLAVQATLKHGSSGESQSVRRRFGLRIAPVALPGRHVRCMGGLAPT